LVLRVVVARVVLFGAGVAMLATGQAMALEPAVQTATAPAEQVAGVAPTWTAADEAAYPGCTPSAAWPAGTPAASVVVQVLRDGRHVEVAFDRAWRLNHNDTEVDDLWVVGVCG
jgi:hypothetical protein